MPAEESKKRKESEEAAEFRSLSKPQESQESPRSREILNLSCCCVLPHIEQRSTSEMFYSTSLKQQSYPDDPLDSIENSLPRRLSCRLASITRLECFLFSRENESGRDHRRHRLTALHFCAGPQVENAFKIHSQMVVRVTPMASKPAQDAHQSCTLALCAHKII